MTRRDFLKALGLFLVGVGATNLLPRRLVNAFALPAAPAVAGTGRPSLVVASGTDKKTLLKTALNGAGGIGAWVKPGATVAIKPNAAWARTPDEAANVHPELLEALINECYAAGARTVKVVEYTCDNSTSALKVNGIRDAVGRTKATLKILGEGNDFVSVDIPLGKKLKQADVARDLLEADLFINMPIAKTHGAATLTIGMKNHMGSVKDRWYFHTHDLHQCIADISTVLRPHLIVVDATRLMLTHGPKGPGEVRVENKVIVGTDQVAVDSYAATLFGMRGHDIGYIVKAHEHGLGEIDLAKMDVKTVGM